MIRRFDPLMASIIALLPLAAASGAPAAAEAGFVAPPGPLLLTRTLRRPLPDGAEIVSTRRYEIRIVADGDGYRVDGRLLDAAVTAPAALEALAAIERNRPDAGLFPFRLDHNGLIASRSGVNDRAADEAAATSAKRAIEGGPLPGPERRQALAIVDRLAAPAGATGARWPVDLFRPQTGQRTQTRQFALPDGQSGAVTTTIDARSDGPGGSIERTVVTESGGARRTVQETYTVARSRG